MSCPICITPEGTAIAAGVRAGGGLLILVTAIVIVFIGRFAWRLWALRLVGVPEDGDSHSLRAGRSHG